MEKMMSNKSLKELMVEINEVQVVHESDCFFDALAALNKNRWGAVFIVNDNKNVLGIITDGDCRRVMANNNEPLAQLNSEPISKYMNQSPTVFKEGIDWSTALKKMNKSMFLCAPVSNDNGELTGIVHIQHLVSYMLEIGTL
jgi:arabinose-5-phosphate isomerase